MRALKYSSLKVIPALPLQPSDGRSYRAFSMIASARQLRRMVIVTALAVFCALVPAPAAQQSGSPASPVAHGTAPESATSQPGSPVIVLDPAHGGTDTGARGENGIFEKDVVLTIARTLHVELARQGYTVVLTRDDDSNPSYNDRAAVANAYPNAIFISLHVASTGTPGTARTYYYRFWTPIASQAPPATNAGTHAATPKPEPPAGTLTAWDDAQRSQTDESRLLADLIQTQLAQDFPGSPAISTGAEVRELRSVDVPAVAIEISSVAVSNAATLTAMAGPLSTAIARSVQAFRTSSSAGTN